MSDAPPIQTTEVLILDDEKSIRLVVRRALELAGFTVWEAASGEEAVGVFCREPGSIGLVIADVALRGMDGVQVARVLRELSPGPRLCFMTGDDLDVRHDLVALEPIAIFPKPFRLKELVRAVNNACCPSGSTP
jgi:two-component system cell cycle sensor histidine kinase/response regulator CckA